jgi:hypothetical protein
MDDKQKWMIVLSLGVFTLGFLLSGMPGLAGMETLDGKVFVGELGKKGDKTGDKDELIFKDGKFRSTACEKYGFTEAPYTANTNGENTSFVGEAMCAKEGTMKWTGTIKEDMVTATITWSKPGKAPQEFWYRGKLKM